MLRRWLALSGPDAQTLNTACAYGNLGVICLMRGQLDEAMKLLCSSLEISEKLGDQAGVAGATDNLGNLAKILGEPEKARELAAKARELYDKIGMKRVPSRLRRRRPVPRTALGFEDLLSGHLLCKCISE